MKILIIILIVSNNQLALGEASSEETSIFDFFNIFNPLFLTSILDASYDDLDGDGDQDDIWIKGTTKISFFVELPAAYTLNVQIFTPSGYLFIENFEITQFDDSIEFVIYSFNTAIESGDYYATFYGYAFLYDFPFCCADDIIFDPPGKNNAEPTYFEFHQL